MATAAPPKIAFLRVRLTRRVSPDRARERKGAGRRAHGGKPTLRRARGRRSPPWRRPASGQAEQDGVCRTFRAATCCQCREYSVCLYSTCRHARFRGGRERARQSCGGSRLGRKEGVGTGAELTPALRGEGACRSTRARTSRRLPLAVVACHARSPRTLAATRSRAAAALVMFGGRTAGAAAGAADRRGVLRQVRVAMSRRRTIRMHLDRAGDRQ
jgi:hypothetical protein